MVHVSGTIIFKMSITATTLARKNIGHGGIVAMAKNNHLRLARQALFHGVKTGSQQVRLLGARSRIVIAAGCTEVIHDPWRNQERKVRRQHAFHGERHPHPKRCR
jgi:hypothetical protein